MSHPLKPAQCSRPFPPADYHQATNGVSGMQSIGDYEALLVEAGARGYHA